MVAACGPTVQMTERLPYPAPLNAAVSLRMSRNRKQNTRPEVALRAALHARGARFRANHLIRSADLAVRPDIVFTRRKLVVFVDGCFWHVCPMHGNSPRRNTDYWGPKLERNRRRDRRVDASLRAAGWTVIRAWEHEPVDDAADRVLAELKLDVMS